MVTPVSGLARRSALEATLLCVALALLAAALLDARYWHEAKQFNAQLAMRDYVGAGQHASAHGRFAEAFRLHRGGQFEAALKAYGDAEQHAPARLQQAVKYNLGNLYLMRAHEISQAGQEDLSLALIELAKESYRDALRIDSAHWPAKHNLARALELAPEPDPLVEEDQDMPERSPRAPQSTRAYERLP